VGRQHKQLRIEGFDAGFIARHVTLYWGRHVTLLGSIPRHVTLSGTAGPLTRRSLGAWRILPCAKRANGRSDHFLSRASGFERLDNRG
jgi:hypothetical protein